MPIQCLLRLNRPELHAVIRLCTVKWNLMMHSYCSYALLWTPIFIFSQHCSIETHNEFVIKWCGVYKIVRNIVMWLFMTHSLAILALTTSGIDEITPESSSYLYRSFSMLNLSFINQNSPSSVTLTAYTLWLQQTWTAESEVLHLILPNRPLTLLQNPKTTEYHQNRMSIQLVYRILGFILIHSPQQTRFEPM